MLGLHVVLLTLLCSLQLALSKTNKIIDIIYNI